jgi:hypothetical protein
MRMIDIEWWQNMGMDCARGEGNQKGRTRNGQNAKWPTTIAALIIITHIFLCFIFYTQT